MSEYRLFKSTQPAVSYFCGDGTRVDFRFHRFVTDNEYIISCLDAEVAKKHPIIYVDPNQMTVTQAELDPLEALKKKWLAEYLQEQKQHIDPNNDMGESVSGPLKAASTSDIAPVAAGSGPGGVAAQLMNLAK